MAAPLVLHPQCLLSSISRPLDVRSAEPQYTAAMMSLSLISLTSWQQKLTLRIGISHGDETSKTRGRISIFQKIRERLSQQ